MPAPSIPEIVVRGAPVAVSHVPQRHRRLDHRHMLLFAAAASICMLLLNVVWREQYEGDEGFYGVTALNMLQSPAYLLRPSYYPAGEFAADKGAFAHFPFNSQLYALALWVGRGSLAAVDVLNVVSFAALLFFVYRLLRLFEVRTALFAVLLLAASPSIVRYYSQLEAEPLMVTCGIIGLYCALRGRHFLSGLCLGLSFALKLWLCGPLALAIAAAMITRGVTWRGLLLFGSGAVLPSAAHLLVTAWFYPEDVGFWLNNAYFGVFTGSGISGDKLNAAAAPDNWVHPWWYYAAALYRDHFFLVPIILFGMRSLFRVEGINRKLLWVIVAGAAGLLPLSLLKVKEPNYILSCAIFLYLLAGACLAALSQRMASGDGIDALSRRFGTLATVGLMLLLPLAHLRGIQPEDITRGFVVAHSLAFAAILGVFWWTQNKRSSALEWLTYAACGIALAAWFSHFAVTRRPRDKVITQLIEPHVNSPNTLSLIASNYKSYQLYAFRRGCYWDELPLTQSPESVLAAPQYGGVRAFILNPDDQQQAALAPWLAWLQTHTTEKTSELDARLGSISGFRLFVR